MGAAAEGRNAHIPPILVLEEQNMAGAEAHLPEENVAVEGARRNRHLERRMITRALLVYIE